ncbi:sensory neuron membrane protein 2 [Contarinia nasturtii]|uniref:sensory neuron membrane protein 2 n=1 Tax=Contarinia nasturtii TaxID=265458 RepID=UPI0012D3CEF8|nr:sensory neuron membrane protein 2 [Contarinia nasturtii]
MCYFKCKGHSKIGIAAVCGFISAVLGAFFGWILFPTLVTLNVDKQTLLEEGTETFERFVNIPQPLSFKVFIFNVTNPSEVIDGGVPNVKEVGPYVYRQYRHKENLEFTDDKRYVIFRGIQKFIFDDEASAPLKESDDLVVLNVQLNSVLQEAQKQPGQLGFLNEQLKEVFGKQYASIFMTVKPSNLLFSGIPLCVDPSGIAEFICKAIKMQRPQAIKEMNDGSLRFSMFGHKNNTDDGLFEIHTGVGDITKLGLIRQWNKQKILKTWLNSKDGKTSTCNIINGTDTTVFAPHIKSNGFLYIFAADICRSVRVHFKKKVTFAGINAYRFEVKEDFLEHIGPEFGNECFCIDKIPNIPSHPNGCLYKGAMDLTTCQGGPIVITLPHMLNTAPEYQTVSGLKPDLEKHLIFADIEPNTGYPIRGAKRLQLNMFLKKINSIDVTEKLKTYLFPIVWIEEGLELNEDMQSLVHWKLTYILLLLDVVHYTMLIGGILIFTTCSIWYLIRRNQENKITPLT